MNNTYYVAGGSHERRTVRARTPTIPSLNSRTQTTKIVPCTMDPGAEAVEVVLDGNDDDGAYKRPEDRAHAAHQRHQDEPRPRCPDAALRQGANGKRSLSCLQRHRPACGRNEDGELAARGLVAERRLRELLSRIAFKTAAKGECMMRAIEEACHEHRRQPHNRR